MNFLGVGDGDGQGTPSVSLRRIMTDAALAQPVPVLPENLLAQAWEPDFGRATAAMLPDL
jgi:hypothetical protein